MALPTTLPGVPSGFEASNINLYGRESIPDVERWQKSVEDAATSLEQRYANPNWFNVAAGFLKPQLGGFAASLGSANEAMGANLEKHRENQLPAAQMRAQVAQSKINMAQRQKAADLAQNATTQPGGLTAEIVAEITNRDPERGKIAQAQFANQQSLRTEIMAQHAAGRTDAQLMADYGPMFKTLYPNGVPKPAQIPAASPGNPMSTDAGTPGAPAPVAAPGTAPGTAPGAPAPNAPMAAPGAPVPKGIDAVSSEADKPPQELGLTQAQWDAMPLQRKNELTASLGTTGKDIALKSEAQYRSAAESAQPKIELYKSMRELAAPADMAVVFNILGGNDIMSMAGKALSQGRLTERLANLDTLLVQGNIDNPDLRRRAAQLAKLINENKAMSDTNAVTDQATALRGAGNPSLENPRDAFISLTDALAHREKNHINLFGMLEQKDPVTGQKYHAPNFMNTDAWKTNKRNFMREHSALLKEPPTDQTPSWYFPSTTTTAPAARPAAASAPSTGGSTRSRLEQRLNRAP